jgi:hypothetical protein
MLKIEGLILEKRDDLTLVSPDLLYSLVYAFGKTNHRSELLYLIEPHILKNLDRFYPG